MAMDRVMLPIRSQSVQDYTQETRSRTLPPLSKSAIPSKYHNGKNISR